MNTRTDAEYVALVSSSGHCSLACSYCIVRPVAKHEPSLTAGDLEFLLDRTAGKTMLIFSGKGDFFAGYAAEDRLLERLLERDVEIVLDINGVLLKELPELDDRQLARLRAVHLTMHYRQLREQGCLEAWTRNARHLVARKGGYDFVLSFVLSPAERALWPEALAFFARRIFAPTAQRLALKRDVLAAFDAADEAAVAALERAFGPCIEQVPELSFAALSAVHGRVLCPAGHRFFRIWNDGAVHGCTFVPELGDCGNLKERRFAPRAEAYACDQARHCECDRIAKLGKMGFESPAA